MTWFHSKIPHSYIDEIIEVINDTPRHQYQIFTKGAEVMSEYVSNQDVPRNAWLGVTVENRRHGVPRIGFLRKMDASVKFLSVEPFLEIFA